MPLLDCLERPHRFRLRDEVALREQGFVPVTVFDASTRMLKKALPRCRSPQVVPDKQPHGRIVWSHPGPSGLDPRSLGPLSLVRVADGQGPDPLDEPLTLGQAVRWLLTQDVEPWLRRPRHRALVEGCILELTESWSCLVHRVLDPLLQDIADALGDSSLSECWLRRGSGAPAWSTARTQPYDLGALAASAVDATRRLADWYAAGERGMVAWQLTLHDIDGSEIRRWQDAGFSTAEAAVCAEFRSLEDSVCCRDLGVPPYLRLPLPSAPGQPAKDRGLHWYAQFQLARRGRRNELITCKFCGSNDYQHPCRTCRAEGRAAPLGTEWAAYTGMATVHPAYADADPGLAVPCGAQNCQTALATSAADEGVRR